MRLLIGCVLAFSPNPVLAQDMEIPVATQIPLFFKVTAFDRRISADSAHERVIVVAFQSGSRQSITAKDEAMRVLSSMPVVDGKTVRAVAVDLDREALQAALRAQNASMLYVTPLRGLAISQIASAARAAQVTTYTGVPKYVGQGLAVSVRRVGDRPKLMVDLRAARLEGADFSAEFLKLVQVVE